MLVVEPSSSCDVCLEPYDWDDVQKTPHIIDCGHVFCAQCLEQVIPTRCPICRKLFYSSEVRKLYVECSSTSTLKEEHKEEVDLLYELIMVYNGSDEEMVTLQKRVDEWLGNSGHEESPLQKTRTVLELFQQGKSKRAHDRKKIKHLEREIRQSLDVATRKEAEVSIMEQSLRSQIAQKQAEIDQLHVEIEKRQQQHEQRKLNRKGLISRPLPLPKIPIAIPNPLPTPPRVVHITTSRPSYRGYNENHHGSRGNLHARLPIYEKDDGFETSDDVAYYTCLSSAPPIWLEDDSISEEPLLRKPAGDIYR
ncbi:hypothetical protein D9757_004036 [Collybiopsis confluens]|uniref:RING-type domain-containing protein n=1 Tax=Collybiopsis confluens TaxID=2823264 RepID=A0A8H5HWL7_9AGAR|nr:hypothetical protein D9757_004036 [Collybiopsis confluens]